MDADDPSIFTLLDALGLHHERRQSARGVPYASFRMVALDDNDTGFTALIDQRVCRLTVHRIAPKGHGPAGLALSQRCARLPLGAAYRSPDDGTLELSVAVWIGGALPPPVLDALLAYATGAAQALLGGAAPERPRVPNPPADRALRRATFEALGHAVEDIDDETRFHVGLTSQCAAQIALHQAEDGWIGAHAHTVPALGLPAEARSWDLLDRLQRWTSAGRFVPSGDGKALQVEVYTPLLGAPASALEWSASQAAAMLSTAARHLAAD